MPTSTARKRGTPGPHHQQQHTPSTTTKINNNNSGGSGTTTAPADCYARAVAAAFLCLRRGSSSSRIGVAVAVAAAVAVSVAAFYIYFVEMCLMPCSYFLLFNLILLPREGSHPDSTDSYVSTCRHVGISMSVRQCRYYPPQHGLGACWRHVSRHVANISANIVCRVLWTLFSTQKMPTYPAKCMGKSGLIVV